MEKLLKLNTQPNFNPKPPENKRRSYIIKSVSGFQIHNGFGLQFERRRGINNFISLKLS